MIMGLTMAVHRLILLLIVSKKESSSISKMEFSSTSTSSDIATFSKNLS